MRSDDEIPPEGEALANSVCDRLDVRGPGGGECRMKCPHGCNDGQVDRDCAVNLGTYLWHCHKCSDGGNWITLLRAVGEEVPGRDSSRPYVAPRRLSKPKRTVTGPDAWTDSATMQLEDMGHFKHGAASVAWKVADRHGRIFGYHARYNREEVDRETGVVTTTGKDFSWMRNGRHGVKREGLELEDAPLYGSEWFSTFPQALPLIITEGEKKSDALRVLHPSTLSITTGSTCKISVETLKEYPWPSSSGVYFWPDYDKDRTRADGSVYCPGLECAMKFAHLWKIAHHGQRVRILHPGKIACEIEDLTGVKVPGFYFAGDDEGGESGGDAADVFEALTDTDNLHVVQRILRFLGDFTI